MDQSNNSELQKQEAKALFETFTKLSHRERSITALKEGSIVFRLTGGEVYSIECSANGTEVTTGIPRSTPLIEVSGEAKHIQAVLEGKRDAVAQFMAGGLRVRGDLRYLSDLALELGILKQPL